jgi:hypothetical protein
MKRFKRTTLIAAAAAVAALCAAGTASATTIEVGGVTQNKAVSLQMTIKPGSSTIFRDTAGFSQNTCTTSVLAATTQSPYTGATATATVNTLTFSNCANEPFVTHKPGTLHFAHIAGTTNATVTSSGAEWTISSPFGTLACITGAGTHLGTLTGSAAGHAALTLNVVLSCSGVSSRLTGAYIVTSPTGFGVSA